MRTKLVHKDTIRPGDIIIFDGKERTVCGGDIRECSFMGRTIFGDSFWLGQKKVEKLV